MKSLHLRVLKNVSKHHFLLHFIVFIWGWSPILGKGISADALQLVWFRIAITLFLMTFYLVYIKANLLVSLKKLLQLSAVGFIICIHWLCFYGAIKVSNVSVTMAAFSTGTLFTAITEPLIYKRKFVWYELVIGLIIIAAICLIFSVEIKYGLGILLGVFAALTASIFSVLNGVLIQDEKEKISSPVLSFIELSAALVGLSIFLLFNGSFSTSFFSINNQDILLITILAGVCTVYPFIASVNLMKHLSPYTINLTVNLEGVYGIILAGILFHENEDLSITFYVGFSIILSVIFLNGILKQKFSKA
ncbi:MAG: DMT family transporter [Burkholderiales bacterium]|nr:DMT family transporter [Bacteroidia bacterium]